LRTNVPVHICTLITLINLLLYLVQINGINIAA